MDPAIPMTVRVQTEAFDAALEQRALGEGRHGVGAVVTFVGLTRDRNDGQRVTAMTLEHYPGMTEKALAALARDAARRWPLEALTLIHRVGTLQPGDPIVFVGVASQHRKEAFRACEFLIDTLKSQVPLWKREQTGQGAHWVAAQQTDRTAAADWSTPPARQG